MNYNYEEKIDRKMAYIKGLVESLIYDASYRQPPWRDNISSYAL